MKLVRIDENDFLDISKVNHFVQEAEDLVCFTNSERIVIPLQARKEVLTALFRKDASDAISKQYVSV